MKIFKILWGIYALFIVYGTIIPFNLVPSNEIVLSNYDKISWIPFIDPDGSRASIPDVVQNILLFLPFGVFGFLSMNQRIWRSIFIATVSGALLSISVEILQLFTIDRTTSTTDLVTNTTGAFLGALTAAFTLDLLSKAITSHYLQKHIQIKYFFPLLIACLIAAAGSLHPFDFTLDVGSLGSKIKFLANQPINFNAVLSDEGVVFIRFFLLAFVCSLCFREWLFPNPAIKGIIFSTLIGLALEGCQIIVESRMPSFQDGIVVVLGSICGGLFTIYCPRLNSPQIWSIMMIAATWMAAMLHTLSPFQFVSEYRSMNWFPFLAYYEKTSFIALSNFVESALIYYPMGFILTYFIDRERSPHIFIGIIAGVIAFPLELSQGWVDGRYPDITDVLGALIGVIFGAWTCREGWKAFERYAE